MLATEEGHHCVFLFFSRMFALALLIDSKLKRAALYCFCLEDLLKIIVKKCMCDTGWRFWGFQLNKGSLYFLVLPEWWHKLFIIHFHFSKPDRIVCRRGLANNNAIGPTWLLVTLTNWLKKCVTKLTPPFYTFHRRKIMQLLLLLFILINSWWWLSPQYIRRVHLFTRTQDLVEWWLCLNWKLELQKSNCCLSSIVWLPN